MDSFLSDIKGQISLSVEYPNYNLKIELDESL